MKLRGIKVIDLTSFLPGPHLTMMMADHGAEVIKIEQPGSGEPTRSIGFRQGGQSVYFRNTNRGKRSLSINLKAPEGREVVLRLAEKADVMIETYRPGVTARLGVDYEAVRQRAPHIVYCSISAFGQDSPLRDRPAHDLSVLGLAGIASLTIGKDGKPTIPATPPSDMSASLMALSGILMALLRAKESGEGDYLDIAMYDCAVSWTPFITGSLFAENRAPVLPEERLFGGAALYNIYETADGRWLTLGGSEAKFATNLLSALGREDLIEAAHKPAGPAQEPVRAFLKETFKGKSLEHWNAWFDGRDICYAPVLDMKEAFETENMTAREMLVRDADGNSHVGLPIKFANEPGTLNPALPALGGDNEAVLRENGFEEAEIAKLTDDGVLFHA